MDLDSFALGVICGVDAGGELGQGHHGAFIDGHLLKADGHKPTDVFVCLDHDK